MRKELMVLGLVGLLGCEKREISAVGENVTLTKPEGCYKTEDIRLEHPGLYQVLCRDEEGNLTLYSRGRYNTEWDKITVK